MRITPFYECRIPQCCKPFRLLTPGMVCWKSSYLHRSSWTLMYAHIDFALLVFHFEPYCILVKRSIESRDLIGLSEREWSAVDVWLWLRCSSRVRTGCNIAVVFAIRCIRLSDIFSSLWIINEDDVCETYHEDHFRIVLDYWIWFISEWGNSHWIWS